MSKKNDGSTAETGSESIAVATEAEQWRQILAEEARVDANQAKGLAVSLDSAHPGGLASLYADAPTRLSSLVREETALDDAVEQIRTLDSFARHLAAKHGQASLHLGVGSASWTGQNPASSVPIFTREVVIEGEEGGELTLQLLPGVEISSRLLREAARAGAPLDRQALAEALAGTGGFSPARALRVVEDAVEDIPGFEIRDELSLRLLTHPTGALYRELLAGDVVGQSAIAAALAGDEQARKALAAPEPQVNPNDRDPWKELGVGDQSPQIQDVIEALAAGHSYVVHPEEGADPVAAAVSVSAALAAEGKSVLVVSNGKHGCGVLSDEFAANGLDPIVANFFPGYPRDEVRSRLESALDETAPRSEDQQLKEMRLALVRAREALTAYEEHLHSEFDDWGVTPFDALQTLTDLTSDPRGPATKVRLDEDSLSRLADDGGERARELLDQAVEQNLLANSDETNPWDSIEFEDAEQVESSLSAIQTLAHKALPAVEAQMTRIADQAHLRRAATLDGWGMQIALIEQAQGLLDIFRPEIFERSPADLIVATAPASWRKEKDVRLKGSVRRQRVRQAKDLIRPGVHVTDLNGALQQVQECRHRWLSASVDEDPLPVIPDGLEHCAETLEATKVQVEQIAPYLEPVFGDLTSMPLDELLHIVDTLAGDPEGARAIPERLELSNQLQTLGLQELLDDFRERSVDPDLLHSELDLAWWASVLGLMLAAEPRLSGFDPGLLQNLAQEIRILDEAQVQSLGPAVVQKVRSRAFDSLSLYPDKREDLASALSEGVEPGALFEHFSLPWELLPIVCAGPALVPTLAKPGGVDVVVAIGMDDLPLAELVPVLSRGENALLFDLPDSPESTWRDGLKDFLTTIHLPARPMAASGPLVELVSKHKPDSNITAIPTPRLRASVHHVHVEGSGAPAPTSVGIESSSAEAQKAAELLVHNLLEHPDRTTAVATLSSMHATRVKSALGTITAADPQALAAVEAKGGHSRLVVSAAELPKIRPDHAIVSVGFAKTANGRLIHDFGILSEDDGIDAIESVAEGAVGEVTVLTTLDSKDFDAERLRKPGEKALLDLLHLAEGRSPVVPNEATDEPDDLLVDLADRLHRLGLPVMANLGSGPYRIPLAVGHPEVPGELLVAVLTDTPSYRAERSLRVRDRYWPEQLEKAGWKVRTELSMAVFIDPNAETQDLVELVLDAVDDYYVRIGKPATPAAAVALAAEGAALREEQNAEEQSDDTEVEPAESEDLEDPHESVEDDDELEDDAEVEELEEIAEPAETTDEPEPATEPLPAPEVQKGLPLAAYSDDELDSVAQWCREQNPNATEGDLVAAIGNAIGLRRRGKQADAVLLSVVERTA